ncbi:hypothetical protein SCUCBS95973_009668 [Sporothrix curviconia]|uniref:Uncharacterized protein n=1 Tax=Sporothrix curviconia TaxID=1260050 RepID=A0ABP0CWU9_9PEZI
MDRTQKELADIKKRISETMTIIDQEKRALDEIISILQSLSGAVYDQIMASSSTSKEKRDIAPIEINTRDEELQRPEDMRNAKQDAIGRMWEKLHDLQQEERDLEGKPRID